jgi:hypothetical protein
MNNSIKPAMKTSKLISAILPKGVALDVIRKLRQEKNLNTASINYARGTGKLARAPNRKHVIEREQEILTVIVDDNISDEIFEYIYQQADINRPHGGLIYMHRLIKSTEYRLPDITEEKH